MYNLNRWRVRFLNKDDSWEGSLAAYWEVEGDPISDDYTPKEVSALLLLQRWANGCKEAYANGLIPIHWFVWSVDAGKFESMPFQYDHLADVREYPKEDFLSFYGWPINVMSGHLLNSWFSLPVVDKLWNEHHAAKGGFIQEATGWKPSVLQPFVYLPSLLEAAQLG